MHAIKEFTSVDVAYPYRLRGAGNQQNDLGLIWQPPSYAVNARGPVAQANVAARTPGAGIGYFSLHNRSGSAAVLGLGVRVPNYLWIAGQWVDAAGTPFTDDTVDAQDADANDFALETTTNNDGFVVASRVPFNAISIDVGTASVDAVSVARAVRYSDPEGDGWIDFANLFIQDGAATNLAATGTTDANEALIVWATPANWGKTQASGLSGIPGGYYAVNVRATDAPTTAALADSLSIYRLYFLTEAVADNGTLEVDLGSKDFPMGVDSVEGAYGDALVALFGTANNQNRVSVMVRGR